MRAELTVTEDQALAFRARRGGLLSGLESPRAAAAAVLGAQAQQEKSGLMGLAVRSMGTPDSEALKAAAYEEPRTLVRTWGQRDTLHLYDPADWPMIAAARPLWPASGRRGALPSEELADAAVEFIDSLGRPASRDDLLDFLPVTWLREIETDAEYARMDARRFGAGRILWRLAQRGDVCAARKEGNTQFYALRRTWFPDLAWDEDPDREGAAIRLTERYFAVYGPATAQDAAHHFGARVSAAKRWVKALQERGLLTSVRCAERTGLFARTEDAEELAAPAPSDWPLALLPLYDTMLMAHKDKTWTVPEQSECKTIWRKAAWVAATVLDRGRIVATWSFKERARSVDVAVEPLSGWRKSLLPGLMPAAAAVAGHLGKEPGELRVG